MKQLLFNPSVHFPQCHASCLLPLNDTRMLCVYFAGKHEKHPDVAIWLSVWEDDQWHPPRLLVKVTDEPHWNPVLFHTHTGIRLVFKVGNEIASWRSYTMYSQDGGRSWSDPVMDQDGSALGPVRSKPIRHPNGFLLAPNSEEHNSWLPYIDISYDEGSSFKRYGNIPINQNDTSSGNFISGRGAIQPTLWTSSDGFVHALLRTSSGLIFRSDSVDGQTWCEAYPTDIPNNNSGIDIAKADDGRLFLACNPVSGDFAERTPLCVFESTDQGKHFEKIAVIEEEAFDPLTNKNAEFSYPSLYIHNNQLHLSYTWNRRSIAYAKLSV